MLQPDTRSRSHGLRVVLVDVPAVVVGGATVVLELDVVTFQTGLLADDSKSNSDDGSSS